MNDPHPVPAEGQWGPLRPLWAAALPDGEPPAVRWWRKAGRLVWEVRAPTPLEGQAAFTGSGFTEGLWARDVAECFLTDPRRGSYVEYNLSPGGAWWGARFVAPRVRAVPQPAPSEWDVETKVSWTPAHWTGQMSMPLPEGQDTLVNFCAIHHGANGADFFSLAALGGIKPDFHRPQEWLSLSF